ncbi:MAG TPA: LacI family DNA-binding transcriptional regulator [Acidimicrobiales bacterium]|nr:LacI family DNA-binding transcriptional regulator [Acidimicrobiales bacterium]
MATISDVAAHAGVGLGTVSRVLNNSPKVSVATRARVMAAMEILDYRPSPLARGLSRGRCHTVGLLVPLFTHASAVERLRGVVAALHDSPYDLVLFDVESPRHRDEHFAALTKRDRADGLLVVSLPPPARDLAKIVGAGVPVVLIDARGDGVPMVITDDVEGGRIATRHLLALGHRRIGYIGEEPDNPFGFTATALREQGYVEALQEAGLTRDGRLVRYSRHDRQAAQQVASKLLALRNRPTAIFASSDVQATGVLAAASAAGLEVPGDVSVVGFDDIEISSYAGLTTVRQPLFESGRIGAEMLLGALDGEEEHHAGVRQLPLDLVVRTTTAAPKAA